MTNQNGAFLVGKVGLTFLGWSVPFLDVSSVDCCVGPEIFWHLYQRRMRLRRRSYKRLERRAFLCVVFSFLNVSCLVDCCVGFDAEIFWRGDWHLYRRERMDLIWVMN